MIKIGLLLMFTLRTLSSVWSEQDTHNVKVGGSCPSGSTFPMVEWSKAPVCKTVQSLVRIQLGSLKEVSGEKSKAPRQSDGLQ